MGWLSHILRIYFFRVVLLGHVWDSIRQCEREDIWLKKCRTKLLLSSRGTDRDRDKATKVHSTYWTRFQVVSAAPSRLVALRLPDGAWPATGMPSPVTNHEFFADAWRGRSTRKASEHLVDFGNLRMPTFISTKLTQAWVAWSMQQLISGNHVHRSSLVKNQKSAHISYNATFSPLLLHRPSSAKNSWLLSTYDRGQWHTLLPASQASESESSLPLHLIESRRCQVSFLSILDDFPHLFIIMCHHHAVAGLYISGQCGLLPTKIKKASKPPPPGFEGVAVALMFWVFKNFLLI